MKKIFFSLFFLLSLNLTFSDSNKARLSQTFSGHSNSVYSVAISSDGNTIATGSSDKTIKLWNASSGRELATLYGHDNSVICVAFNVDGSILASGSEDKTVKIWNVNSQSIIRTLSEHSAKVSRVAFSPDGQWLASGDENGEIYLWNTYSWSREKVLRGHQYQIWALQFSPDSKYLMSLSSRWEAGDDDNSLRVWDVQSGTQKWKVVNSNKERCATYSPNGKVIASGGEGGTIHFWDTDNGEVISSISSATSSAIRAIGFLNSNSIFQVLPISLNTCAFFTSGILLIASSIKVISNSLTR